MPTTQRIPQRRKAPAPEVRAAFLSRGTDLLYRAKRLVDGQVIAEDAEKGAARHAAELLGYSII